jgi:Tfp pilus assembly protein PilX
MKFLGLEVQRLTTAQKCGALIRLISTFSYLKAERPHNLRTSKPTAGFTLMIAALVASLLTALGIAMFTIATKEVVLSSLGRDSQFAFYAADTGAECALLWDFKYEAFSTSTIYNSTTTPAECAGQELQDFPTPWESGNPDGITGLGGGYDTTFWFEPNGYCVYVTVSKQDEHPRTTVEALGYSTSCNQPNHPRRLERAVRARF